jgi:acyl-CoA synthetase (NDP forming)
MGVRSLPGAYDTFFVPDAKLPMRRPTPQQPLALVSQSGAFIVSRLSSNSDLNPRFAISIGNQVDVVVSDLVAAVGERPDISVVGVYLEGFADLDGAALLAVVAELRKAGKEVVFYKAGRTESGRSAAAGHTAAVAGDYDICLTALRHAGAFVAEDFREFGLALELALGWAGKSTGNGRVFAMTNAGMEAVAMADSGLKLTELDDQLKSELDRVLTEHGLRSLVSPRNPLDLTPAAGEAAYEAALHVALESDSVDVVVVSCVPLAPTLHSLESELGDPTSFASRAGAWSEAKKPVVVVFDGGSEYEALRRAVRAAGLPVFASADDAARLIGRWTGAR